MSGNRGTTSGASAGVREAARRYVKPIVGASAWNYVKRVDRQLRRRRQARQRAAQPAVKPAVKRPNLTELAKLYKTDKWGVHRYTPHYEEHFRHLRTKPIRLFEIGIGITMRNKEEGASLRMWKDFFPNAQIVGLDIEDKSSLAEDRITIYQGDQGDPEILNRINRECGPFDIIIDDGSHRVWHVLASFEVLFPLLKDGGIYAIEDIQSSYWPEWGGSEDLNSVDTSMALCKRLADGINYEEYVDEGYQPSYTDLNVVGAHFYHNLVLIEKGVNNEGTNRRGVLRSRYRKAAEPDAS